MEVPAGRLTERVVHGVAVQEVASDIERLERADEAAYGRAAQLPDASRVVQTVSARQLGEVCVRLLHQEGGARRRAPAADAASQLLQEQCRLSPAFSVFLEMSSGLPSLVGAGKAVFLELVLMLLPPTIWSVLLVVLFT